jgi:very-short-patch-repair endonuclease
MPRPPHLRPHIAGKRAEDGVDRAIAELAQRQHGVVSRRQLVWLGYTRHEIDRRIASGMLHVVHRGVYAVGHRRLTREGRWFAALLAAGPDAVLSHESAAVVWRLRDEERDIEVSVARRRRRRRGLCIHEAQLPATDTTSRHGIPVTTPIRTLLDLARTLTLEALEEAIRQAEYHRLASAASLSKTAESRHGESGVKALRTALEKADLGKGPTRNGLEQRFRRFVREHDLPRPTRLNAPIELNGRRIEVDVLWRRQRLIVELDGGGAHMTTDAFHDDRARDQELVAAGFRVIRITWWQLKSEPERIVSVLRRLVAESG